LRHAGPFDALRQRLGALLDQARDLVTIVSRFKLQSSSVAVSPQRLLS
jgi:hypothetical protein